MIALVNIRIVVVFALCCLGVLIYSNIFANPFQYDDFPQIVNNQAIRDLGNLRAIWAYFPTRFVTFLSFALNYHWGALDVRGYHAVSLFFHLGTSLLVFWLASLTFDSLWPALFAGAIFVAHPVQTEAVNYIFQRSVILAAFFYILSLILYIKARRTQKEGFLPWGLYMCSITAAAAAMLSKEMSVSLPLVVCLYEFYFLKGGPQGRWKLTIPFFLMALLIPLLTIHSLNFLQLPKAAQDYSGVSAVQYFLTELRVKVTYLRLIFMPIHQSIAYDFFPPKSFWEIPTFLSAVFLGIVLGAGVILRKKFSILSFGILWFFLTLLPESSIFPINIFACEYRLYLPLAGFCFFLPAAVFVFSETKALSLTIRFFSILVLIFAFLAYQRNKVWQSDFSLWDDAVHQAPKNQMAYLNRGVAYQRQGDLDRAMADYNMIIGLGPVTAVTLSNRGAIFMEKGLYDLAMANFNLAIKINPSYLGTYMNRARLFQLEGKMDRAMEDYHRK